MSLARIKVWVPGDVLTAADLNGEFNNLIDHPISLISPSTGPIDFNSQAHTNFRLQNVGTTPTAATAGLVYFNTVTGQVQVDDGSVIRGIPSLVSSAMVAGDLIVAASSAPNVWKALPATSTNALTTGAVLQISTDGTPVWDARYRTMQKWNMGTSIVSATTLVLSSDGNYYQVSSSTAPVITNLSTATAGTLVALEFLSTMQMVNSSDRILLDGRVNTILSSGDALLMLSASSTGAWRQVGRSHAYGNHYNLDIRTSGVTIANTTVETTMYSLTIPGGSLQGRRQLSLDLQCSQRAATVTSSNARTYRVYVAGVQPVTSAISNTWGSVAFNGATTGPEWTELILNVLPGGSSASVVLEMFGNSFFAGMPFGTYLLTSVDWSADQKVDITAQWSSASANNSIAVLQAQAYVF